MPFSRLAPHNAACNDLYQKFQECEIEHPVGRFAGYCTSVHTQLRNCLKVQRDIRQAENLKKSEELHKRIQGNMRHQKIDL